MSVAYYIVLDNDEPGFSTFVEGKAVARAIEELDAICEEAGLETLESFMGQSVADYADRDEDEPPDGAEDDMLWFEPEDGIIFFDALIAKIEESEEDLNLPDGVLDDLIEYRQVLIGANEIGAMWYLAMDI